MAILENKMFLVATAGAGAAALMGCACLRPTPQIDADEDDEEARIPTTQDLKALKQRGKSEEEIAREEAYATLPERKAPTAVAPPGSIVRTQKTYAPRVHPLKQRTAKDFPVPGQKTNPMQLWENPAPEDCKKDAKDATRWAWNSSITVDEGTELVSTETQYQSEGYGVRVIFIPTLRLADTQFYDRVLDRVMEEKAVVMMESLHGEPQESVLKQLEKHSANNMAPYDNLSRQRTSAVAKQRGMEGAMGVISSVGGECMTLDYLTEMTQRHCNWLLADPPLSQESMANIGITVNHQKSFVPLCAIREAYLMKTLDRCFRAARTDESWKELTGQEREGEKVIAVPWNGRHGKRVEKFLVEYRGFTPLTDKQTHRIVFDPSQTDKMVVKAAAEDKVESGLEKLADIDPPVHVPEDTMPPHNFGPLAEEMQANDSMRALNQVSEVDGKREYLDAIVDAGREMPAEGAEAETAEQETEDPAAGDEPNEVREG
eukprot:TRINITY_DN51009_c0_g1_i1.p1 TRINITY_DN51009_c0_g1~~TRINITY_DN51009_c0_g1_i1.p1  ORF type:complete len:497 (+),score=201.94 TRINITY_DN51009_c0_g1_i1:29-1492(+)